ncbi:MAG: arsenate reductase ArsC, partial [Candidatus Latescibacterota bacterium]
GDEIEVYSAGVKVKGLDPRAVHVMAEEKIDISAQRSKHVDELAGIVFDYVITVCDNARESCPVFSGGTRTVHVGFDDPPSLARAAKNEEEALEQYRRVRDEIRQFVEILPAALSKLEGQ